MLDEAPAPSHPAESYGTYLSTRNNQGLTTLTCFIKAMGKGPTIGS